MFMAPSLIQFLIFCNQLWSEPSPFGRLDPNAGRTELRSGTFVAG